MDDIFQREQSQKVGNADLSLDDWEYSSGHMSCVLPGDLSSMLPRVLPGHLAESGVLLDVVQDPE